VTNTDNGDDDALEKCVLAALGRSDGLHRLAERLVSILLRLDMPGQLAELARVPEEKRDGFLLSLFRAVIDVWEHHDSRNMMAVALKKNEVLSEVLSRAIGALRATRQALTDLDDASLRLRSHEGGLADSLFWGKLREITADIEQGADSFFRWVEEETDPPLPRAHRRGRRPGTVKNRRFRHFLRELRRAAKAHGGSLGLQKNVRKGALLEAIEIVAPHLPAGFVPKRLSASTLQRIISGR
jgi:hypothetical protein